jgi:HK97 family phage major capsid protein
MFEKRADLVAGTDTAGGHTVPTSTESLIPILRPRMRVESLGATVLSGLSGNLDFPKQDGASVAVWEGETDENAQSDATFKKLTMSPKRVGAFTKFSKQLLAQSSISVENFVRNDLEIAIALAVDAAAINGSGAGNQPTGLLNTTGIGSVAIGANGGAATRNQLVDLESAIAAENADEGVLAFLTTPGVRGALRKTKTDAGSGIFVWGEMANTLLGYNAQVSTQVPSNLTKGSGTNLHAMLFGDFSKLVLGNWAGLDIVIDPYTLATQAMVKVTVNSWWDIMVRYPKAFSAIKDIAV